MKPLTYLLPLEFDGDEEALFIFIDEEAEDGFEYEVVALTEASDDDPATDSAGLSDIRVIEPTREGVLEALNEIAGKITGAGVQKLKARILSYIVSRDAELAERYGLETGDAAA